MRTTLSEISSHGVDMRIDARKQRRTLSCPLTMSAGPLLIGMLACGSEQSAAAGNEKAYDRLAALPACRTGTVATSGWQRAGIPEVGATLQLPPEAKELGGRKTAWALPRGSVGYALHEATEFVTAQVLADSAAAAKGWCSDSALGSRFLAQVTFTTGAIGRGYAAQGVWLLPRGRELVVVAAVDSAAGIELPLQVLRTVDISSVR